MPKASHIIRYSLFAFLLAAVALGAALLQSSSPALAAGQNIYVGASAVDDTGTACTAHSVSYPHCYLKIQSAINGGTTVNGDKIWVDDGTYLENVTVNKSLTLVTLNGPGGVITPPGVLVFGPAPGPTFDITVDNVTLGGPGGSAGKGFTIASLDNASGSSVVRIDGTVVKGDSVVVQNNLLWGTETENGILVTGTIEGGHLVIQNNTFATSPAPSTYAFRVFIHFQSTAYPPISPSVSVFSANIDILNNDGTDAVSEAINFPGDIFFSTVDINGNDFAIVAPSLNSGIYVGGDIRTFSVVTITDTAFRNVGFGIYGSAIDTQSSLSLNNVTVDNFGIDGVSLSGVHNQSALSIVNSNFNGDSSTASDGVYIGGLVENASIVTVSKTKIKDFGQYGIEVVDTVQNGSTMLVQDATLNGISGGATGGITLEQGVQGSALAIDPTTITNFTNYGIYVQDQAQGSTVKIDGNTLYAHSNGAEYCFEFEFAPNQNSHGEITNNTCIGFGGPNAAVGGGYGVYTDNGMYYKSSWLIDHNILTSHADGASEGFHVSYVTTDSHLTLTNNTAEHLTYRGVIMSGTEDHSSSIISDNTLTALTGSGANDGMTLDDVTDNSTATVDHNTITGFDTNGIAYSIIENSAKLDITRNTITAPQDGMDYLIYMDDIDYQSHVTVNSNTGTGFGGPNASIGYGFYIDYVDNGSSLSMDDDHFTAHADGGAYGVYMSTGTQYGSRTSITNSRFDGYTSTGLYLYDARYDGDVTVTGNVGSAHANNSTYGIYFDDIDHGDSNVIVNDNSFFGWDYIGLYVYEVDEASSLDLHHNTFTGDGGTYGFYIEDTFDTSRVKLTNNTFSGYETAGFKTAANVDNGSQLTLLDNVFAAEDCTPDAVPTLPFTKPYGCLVGPNGSEYGFYMEYGEYGSTVDIERNVFTGFGGTGMSTGYGFYADYGVYEGGLLKLIGNKFYGAQGNAADAPDYGIEFNSYLVEYGGDAYIQDNTVTEFDYVGIDPYYVEEGNATVTGNTVTGDPFGSEYGIRMSYTYSGSTVQINNNIVSNIGTPNAGTGYEAYMDTVDASNVSWDGNTFSATPDGTYYCAYVESTIDNGAKLAFTNNHCNGYTDYGFYTNNGISTGSVLRVDGNTFAGDTADGVNVSGATDTGSSLYVDDNNISGFSSDGIYFPSADASAVTVNGNTIAGALPFGGDNGIYDTSGISSASTAEFNGNTISNIDTGGVGIYHYDTADGSKATACSNHITFLPGSLDHVGLQFEYLANSGSTLIACNNQVLGYGDTGLDADSGGSGGGTNTISGNIFTATGPDANYGLFLGPLSDGEVTHIESNSFSHVNDNSVVYIKSIATGSTTTVHNNAISMDKGTDYGVHVVNGVTDGSEFDVTQNEIKGFDLDGIHFTDGIWGSKVNIQNNIIVGGGTNNGINFATQISFGAIVNVLNNCISKSTVGVHVEDFVDTSQVHVNQNDLGDLAGTPTAISAASSTKVVDGQHNWFGSPSGPSGGTYTGSGTAVTTKVDADNWLNSAPSCSGTSATPTPSPTPILTATPFVCGTGSPTASPSPSPTPSPSPVPTAPGGATPRPTRTPGFTATPVPSGSVTPTNSPTPTGTPTQTPVTTPGTGSPTPSPCPTQLGVTQTPKPATATPTPTPSPTPSPTPVPTPVGTGTTQRPTRSPIPTPSPTKTP